ncbi:MAG: ABC transporter ATP-binding protein [Planctomycetaceae bacterium]|nr:ABC transporter ATP-binding protein [Planctomycetaceae bacterium]
MSFLEMTAVRKGYGPAGSRTEVLGGIDLSIEKGEFVAIVGFSGAGKTTLISILAGLLAPDSGSVRLNGKEITEPGRERAVIFQNYSLLPWMTVFENVALGVDQAHADWPAARRREHVEKYVAMVKLTQARSKKPGELSGGMRQRVAVARALATDPEILLMDEPLGALDALTRATLQDEIERIWEEDRKTVVLITNDVDEAVLLADRIIPMTPAPAAVLGPSVTVDIDRPRDRKSLNHDPRFKSIRNGVIEFLLQKRALRTSPTRTPAPATV